MASPKSDLIIRIHGIAGAKSACRVMGAAPFTVLSPMHAAMSLGAGWFGALIDQTREEFPNADFKAVLDCRGRRSGALAAFELGVSGVIVDPMPDDALDRLTDLGRQSGCQVMTALPVDADLYEMADTTLPDHELDRRLRLHLNR